MIYLKNTTEIQTIHIDRNDEIPCGGHHAGSSDYMDGYDEGFVDGYESGTTDQINRLASTAFTYNSAFTRTDGWSAVTVNVPQSGHTSEELQEWYDSGYTDGETSQKELLASTAFTENGHFEIENGWNEVDVNVDTASTYQSGYTEGIEDGKDIQKRLMVSTAFTFNGVYQHNNGWSAVTVNVNQSGHTDQELFDMYESGYTSGFTDGVTSQKALLSSTAFTENGHYERENGWDEIDVNVDTASTYQSGFTEGYESGITETKGKMSSSAFTYNGTYINPSGWSAISISVNQSGWTDEDLQNSYNSGYTDGRNDGFLEGYGSGHTEGYASGYSFGFASGRTYQRSLLTTTAFTENGTYTNENGWREVTVDIDNMGELYCLYLENGKIELDAYRNAYDDMDFWGLPLSNMTIEVYGNYSQSSNPDYYGTLIRNFMWSGNSSTYRFSSGALGYNLDWRNSTTSSTITTTTFPYYHAIKMYKNGSAKVAYGDSVSISAMASISTAGTVTISGGSVYVKAVDVGGRCGEYFPYVDENGKACLRGYLGNLHYPTTGKAYAVYKKMINGKYIYYMARTIE